MIGLGSDKKNCWLQFHIKKIWKFCERLFWASLRSMKHHWCQNQWNIFCISAILLGAVYLIFDLIRPAWFQLSCDKQEWLFFATPYFSLFATAYFSARLVARLQVVIGRGQGSAARGGEGGDILLLSAFLFSSFFAQPENRGGNDGRRKVLVREVKRRPGSLSCGRSVATIQKCGRVRGRRWGLLTYKVGRAVYKVGQPQSLAVARSDTGGQKHFATWPSC